MQGAARVQAMEAVVVVQVVCARSLRFLELNNSLHWRLLLELVARRGVALPIHR